MFSTAGYFRGITCPYYASGLCERPYCHFRHVKPEEPRGAACTDESGTSTVPKDCNGGKTQMAPRNSLLSMVGDAIKQVQRDIEKDQAKLANIKCTDNADQQQQDAKKNVVSYKPTPLNSKPSNPPAPLYGKRTTIPQYNPTPIQVLKQQAVEKPKSKYTLSHGNVNALEYDPASNFSTKGTKQKLGYGGVKRPLPDSQTSENGKHTKRTKLSNSDRDDEDIQAQFSAEEEEDLNKEEQSSSKCLPSPLITDEKTIVENGSARTEAVENKTDKTDQLDSQVGVEDNVGRDRVPVKGDISTSTKPVNKDNESVIPKTIPKTNDKNIFDLLENGSLNNTVIKKEPDVVEISTKDLGNLQSHENLKDKSHSDKGNNKHCGSKEKDKKIEKKDGHKTHHSKHNNTVIKKDPDVVETSTKDLGSLQSHENLKDKSPSDEGNNKHCRSKEKDEKIEKKDRHKTHHSKDNNTVIKKEPDVVEISTNDLGSLQSHENLKDKSPSDKENNKHCRSKEKDEKSEKKDRPKTHHSKDKDSSSHKNKSSRSPHRHSSGESLKKEKHSTSKQNNHISSPKKKKVPTATLR